ncbi:MAG: hypothetical protein K2M91_04925, partial [Lachnospiraceae bacterium]|nr:hypothetical protein [Lachnospiraceae bacterium]
MGKEKQTRKLMTKVLAALLCISLTLQNLPLTAFAAEQGTESESTVAAETQETEESGEDKESAQEEQLSSADEGEKEETSDFIDEEIIKDTDLTEETPQTDIETNKTETNETKTNETDEIETNETDETGTNETETEIATEEDIEVLYETVQEEYEELMVELAASENTYKITENQLFMQAPQYLLKDTPHDEYLTRCFNYTRQAMDDVSTTQTWWAIFMKGLKDGSEIVTKEIASACGLTGSNYDKQKKDLAGELLREYMGNEEYLGSSAQKLSKQLKGLDKIADADLKIQKEEYKEQLKEAFTSMTDSDIDKAVDTVFGKLDKITGYADKAVDAFDIITSIMANQELQLEVIDDLMVSLQDSRDGDLYDGLILIRNDVTSDIGTYILENYLTDKAIGKVKGVLSDAIYDAVSGLIGKEITISAKVIVGIAVNAGVCCYEHFNPSVDDIVHTTIMYNYALTLDNAVLKYKMNFYNKKAGEEDIECFKVAYSAELCAVKLIMKYAKKLTSKKALKNTLDSYRESIG